MQDKCVNADEERSVMPILRNKYIDLLKNITIKQLGGLTFVSKEQRSSCN